MKYLEINFKIIFKKDIYVKDIMESLSTGINTCLLNDENMKKLHYNEKFKPYSFSFPDESIEDNIYKKYTPYTIRFRAVEELFEFIFVCLQERNNPIFYITDASRYKEVNQKNINLSKLVSLTPVVITTNSRCMTLDKMDLSIVKKQIQVNTIKKYNQFTNNDVSLDVDFIEDIQCLNKKAISYHYKNGFIIGNKYLLQIKDDELSQKLGFTMLYSGIGEKNSLGLGFCYMKK